MKTEQPKTQPTESADVEGQGFLLHPTLTRHAGHERTKDPERSAGERARQKEARPNRQHQR